MSVLHPPPASPPPAVSGKSSRFLGSDLHCLNNPSTAFGLPLACIGLIDLNAFFAQCEQLRLGKSIDDPVVCCQWLSLIAVLYAARKYGIGRMDTLVSAREKCPDLIVGHAAVFKKGEAHWQYLDRLPDQLLYKVSLDPYRRELRKIIKVLKRECDLVEKASVDECYMDFGRSVYARLVGAFPFLAEVGSGELLPPVPELPEDMYWVGKVIGREEKKWKETDSEKEQRNESEKEQGNKSQKEQENGDEKEQENESETEKHNECTNDNSKESERRTAPTKLCTDDSNRSSEPILDWDDVVMLIGSQLLFHARSEIYRELRYTTSGGLGSCKTMAKLAGGFIKPDFQTIVRPLLAEAFLTNFRLTDFTMMGGKTGEAILQKLGVPPEADSIAFIRDNWPLDNITQAFASDPPLAKKVYELVRGINYQELKLRTDVKSMMSRKNFQAKRPVQTVADAFDWIKVFVGDLYGRLIELDDENMNLQNQTNAHIYRPRTASIQITTSSYVRFSKQMPIAVLRDLDKFRRTLEVTGFRLFCDAMDASKAPELNDVKLKDLKVTDLPTKTVPIPKLANMALVVSNFVKTSDSSLIDSYGSSGKEDVNRRLGEINLMNENKRKAEALLSEPPRRVARSNSYIKKLFADFEADSKLDAKVDEPKPKLEFKEDKQYVEKLFSEFNASAQVEKALSESPKKSKPQAKSQNAPKSRGVKATQSGPSFQSEIKNVSDSTPLLAEDPLLRELITTQFCSQCNVAVEDVFEHKDFHIALDLSVKLNGDRRDPVLERKTRARGQSQLPF